MRKKKKGPNPDNKCAHLMKRINEDPSFGVAVNGGDMLRLMWQKQELLQRLLKTPVVAESCMERMREITVQWRNLCVEFGEMMQRLPYKEWKKYRVGDLDSLTAGTEERAETLFEYVDMLHFFINIGLCLGLDADQVFQMYMVKADENRDRKRRGY